MKKNILSMAALLMASAAVFTACSSDDNITGEQPANPTGKYTMTINASKGDGATTRALSLSGSTLNATWAAGEKVSVYNVTKGTDLGGELEAQSDGARTTLKGTLTGTINENDVLTLKFLSPNYGTQDGTLTGSATSIDKVCDYAEATVTVASVAGGNITTTTDADFVNQQAIVKFTLKNKADASSLSVTQLFVTADGTTYTVMPTTAASELFVAIPAIDSKRVTLTALASDSKYYDYAKTSATFATSEYYSISASLSEVKSMSEAVATNVGRVISADGMMYVNAESAANAGTTAAAIIAYVGSAGSVDASSPTYTGLAIAMSDYIWYGRSSSSQWGYDDYYDCVDKYSDIATAIGYKDGISNTNKLTTCGHTHQVATVAKSNNGTAAPTGTSGWFLPSIGQWNLIVKGLASKKAGSDVTTDISGSSNNAFQANNLNSVITDAGGTGFESMNYNSSTLYDREGAWHMNLGNYGGGCVSHYGFSSGGYVRSILAFTVESSAGPTYPLLSAATTADYGKVVCADGHLHDAKTAVPDGCTAVGILGKVTETGHGLILALKNATAQNWNTINGWTSTTDFAGTTLKVLPDDAARGSLTSYTTLGETAVSNWAVAQKDDYEAIFINLGSTISNNKGTTYDGNVNAYITTNVGGTAMSNYYWSATENSRNYAWYFGSGSGAWNDGGKTGERNVRPVLGFGEGAALNDYNWHEYEEL